MDQSKHASGSVVKSSSEASSFSHVELDLDLEAKSKVSGSNQTKHDCGSVVESGDEACGELHSDQESVESEVHDSELSDSDYVVHSDELSDDDSPSPLSRKKSLRNGKLPAANNTHIENHLELIPRINEATEGAASANFSEER